MAKAHEQFHDDAFAGGEADQLETLEQELATLNEERAKVEAEATEYKQRSEILYTKLEQGAGDMEEAFTQEYTDVGNRVMTAQKKLIDIQGKIDKKTNQIRQIHSKVDKQSQKAAAKKPQAKGKQADADSGADNKKAKKNKPAQPLVNLGTAFDALNTDPVPAPIPALGPTPAPQGKSDPNKAPKQPQQQKPPKNTKPAPKPKPMNTTPGDALPKEFIKTHDFSKLSLKALGNAKADFERELDREQFMLSGDPNPKQHGSRYKYLTDAEKAALEASIDDIEQKIKKIDAAIEDKKKKKAAKQQNSTASNNPTTPPADPHDPPDPDSQDTSRQPGASDVQLQATSTNTNDMNPTPTPGAERGTTAAEGFNITTALNKKGFAEYLAKFNGNFEDDIENGDTAEIEKYYEAFTKSEVAKKELGSLFKNEIKNDLGVGLEKAELDAIDAFIDSERISNPEGVVEIAQQIEEFRATNAAIAEQEKAIKEGEEAIAKKMTELGGQDGINTLKQEVIDDIAKAQDLEKQANDMAKDTTHAERVAFAKEQNATFLKSHKMWRVTHFFTGWIFGFGAGVVRKQIEKLQAEAAELTEKTSKKKDSYEQVENAAQQLEHVKRMRDHLKATHTILKQMIFDAADSNNAIRDLVQKRMMAKLDEVITPKDPKQRTLKHAEDQQKALDRLRKAETTRGTLIDTEIEAKQKELDAAIEAEFDEEVTEALAKFNGGENNAFSTLEKALTPFFSGERAAKLGSKEGEDARDFILKTIEAKRNEPANKGAKSILLSLLLKNLKQATN